MKIEWLGRIEYQTALRLQEVRLDDCWKHGEESVLLLEHEPFYTIGRLPDKSSLALLTSSRVRSLKPTGAAKRPMTDPVNWLVTPILDLRTRGRDLHCYLRKLEDLVAMPFISGIPKFCARGKFHL